MAITYLGQILATSRSGLGSPSGGTTWTTSGTTMAVPGGNSIIAVLSCYSGGVPASITDSAGNTYTVDATLADPYGANGVVASVHNCLPLPVGGTLTVTWATAPAYDWYSAVVGAFGGLATSATRDVVATATTSTTALSAGPTAATAQADELVIGAGDVYTSAGMTMTAGAGFTAVGSGVYTYTNGPYYWISFLEYKIVSAVGPQTATATGPAPAGSSNGFGVVTYKGKPSLALGSSSAAGKTTTGAAILQNSAVPLTAPAATGRTTTGPATLLKFVRLAAAAATGRTTTGAAVLRTSLTAAAAVGMTITGAALLRLTPSALRSPVPSAGGRTVTGSAVLSGIRVLLGGSTTGRTTTSVGYLIGIVRLLTTGVRGSTMTGAMLRRWNPPVATTGWRQRGTVAIKPSDTPRDGS